MRTSLGALALVTAWGLGNRLIRTPVGRLAAAASRWTAGDYRARSGVSGASSTTARR